MSDEQIKRFIELSRRLKTIKDEQVDIEKELKDMHDPLREWFLQTGTKELRRHGGLLKLKRKVEVHPIDGRTSADVCRVLQETGHQDLVNDPQPSYHWSRLPALWKEAERGDIDWPTELEAITNVVETWVPNVTGLKKG